MRRHPSDRQHGAWILELAFGEVAGLRSKSFVSSKAPEVADRAT
jgi:hypothetical protein